MDESGPGSGSDSRRTVRDWLGQMLLLLGFVLLTLLGLVAIMPMKRSLEPIESVAVAFGVGAGIATLGFFVVAVPGVTLSGMHMALVILAALVLLTTFYMWRTPNLHELLPRRIQRPSLNSLDVCLILMITLFSSAVCLFLSLQAGLIIQSPRLVNVGDEGDQVYVSNFHQREGNESSSFRWSKARSYLTFPDAGYVPMSISLTINGWRPDDQPAPRVLLLANGRQLAFFVAAKELQTYEFQYVPAVVPLEKDLIVEIRSDTFTPASDEAGRTLGVLAVSAQFTAIAGPVWSSYLLLVVLLSLATGLLFLILRLLRPAGWPSFAATLAFLSLTCAVVVASPLKTFSLALWTSASCSVAYGSLLVSEKLRRRMAALPRGLQRPSLNSLDVFLMLTITFVSGAVLLIAIYWPPYSWDAIAIWVAKARAVYASQTLKGVEWGAFPFYPPHLPLLMGFFLHLAPLQAAKLVFPCYYLSLLLVFATSLTRFSGRTTSLGVTLLLATVPYLMYQATIAYADLTFTFYYTCGSLLLYRFTRASDPGEQSRLLTLSGVVVGLASWTRPEGLMYFVINSVVLVSFWIKRKTSPGLLARYGVACSVFGVPWAIYSQGMGYDSYLLRHLVDTLRELASLHIYWDQIAAILRYFGHQAIDFGIWGPLWVLFLSALVLYPKRAAKEAVLVALVGLNMLAVVFTYYAAGGPGDLSWWLETGFNRMTLHFAPLLLFYCGLCFDEDLRGWLERTANLARVLHRRGMNVRYGRPT